MEKDTSIHPALCAKDTVVIQLRTVPVSLHRALRIEAVNAGMSMEQYIVGKLQELSERG